MSNSQIRTSTETDAQFLLRAEVASYSDTQSVFKSFTGTPYSQFEIIDAHPGVTFERKFIADLEGVSPVTGKPVKGAWIIIGSVDLAELHKLGENDNPCTKLLVKSENGKETFATHHHFMRGQDEAITLLHVKDVVHENPGLGESNSSEVTLQISRTGITDPRAVQGLEIEARHGKISSIDFVFKADATNQEINQYFNERGLQRGEQSDRYLIETMLKGTFTSNEAAMEPLVEMTGKQAVRETGYKVTGVASDGVPFVKTFGFNQAKFDSNNDGQIDEKDAQVDVFLKGKGEPIYNGPAQPDGPLVPIKSIGAQLFEGANRDVWDPARSKTGICKKYILTESHIWAADGRSLLATSGDVSFFASGFVDLSKHKVLDDSHTTLEVRNVGTMDRKGPTGATLTRYELTWKTKAQAENILEGEHKENAWSLGLKDRKKLVVTADVEGNVDKGEGQTHTVEENDPFLGGAQGFEIEEVTEAGDLVEPRAPIVKRSVALIEEAQDQPVVEQSSGVVADLPTRETPVVDKPNLDLQSVLPGSSPVVVFDSGQDGEGEWQQVASSHEVLSRLTDEILIPA